MGLMRSSHASSQDRTAVALNIFPLHGPTVHAGARANSRSPACQPCLAMSLKQQWPSMMQASTEKTEVEMPKRDMEQ